MLDCKEHQWGDREESTGPLGIDYLYLDLCYAPDWHYVIAVLMLIWSTYLIKLLAGTASKYFSPTLGCICTKMNMAYDIAGITLLAFGNGAPDFFAMVASVSRNVDIQVSAGALLGGSVFNCTVVIGTIAIICPSKVSGRIFCRDIFFYLLAVTWFTTITVLQNISVVWAFVLIGTYILYFLVVVFAPYLVKLATERMYGRERNDSVLGDDTLSSVVSGTDHQTAFWHSDIIAGSGSDADLPSLQGESGVALSNRDSITNSAVLRSSSNNSSNNPLLDNAKEHVSIQIGTALGNDLSQSESRASYRFTKLSNSCGEHCVDTAGLQQSTPASESNPADSRCESTAPPIAHSIESVSYSYAADSPAAAGFAANRVSCSRTCESGHGGGGSGSSSGGGSDMGLEGGSPDNTPAILIMEDYFTGPAGGDTTGGSDEPSSSAVLHDSLLVDSPFAYDDVQQTGTAAAVGLAEVEMIFASSGTISRKMRLAGDLKRKDKHRYRSILMPLYWQQWLLRRGSASLPAADTSSDGHWTWLGILRWAAVCLEYPVTVLRDMTIPTLDERNWYKPYAILHPVMDPLFIAFIFGYLTSWAGPLPVSLLCLAVGLIPSFCIFALTHTSYPPKGRVFVALWTATAFVMCVAWIYLLAGELVTCLTALGRILDIPASFLGLTVLAWGNSMGEFFTNFSVAKQGLGEMAIAGSYGGPVFDMLISLGVSLAIGAFHAYPHKYHMGLGLPCLVSLGFLYVALCSSLAIVYWRGFKIDRSVGLFLIGLYSLYMVVQVALVLLL